jgi:hypothetical protein
MPFQFDLKQRVGEQMLNCIKTGIIALFNYTFEFIQKEF